MGRLLALLLIVVLGSSEVPASRRAQTLSSQDSLRVVQSFAALAGASYLLFPPPLGEREMTAGTTLFCPPECNPTYGHIETCERYNPRDPKAKLRARLDEAQERVNAEMRGDVPRQRERVEVDYRQVNEAAYAPMNLPNPGAGMGVNPRYANGLPGPLPLSVPVPTAPMQVTAPVRPLLELSKAAFLSYCGAGNVPGEVDAEHLVNAAAKLLDRVDELEAIAKSAVVHAAAVVPAA